MNGDGGSWKVAFEIPDETGMSAFDTVLETLGGAITAREIDNGPRWLVIVHCAEKPDLAALEADIAAAAAGIGLAPPVLSMDPVPATDWVSDYQRRTRPVTVGSFFIYPSHYRDGVPSGLYGIRLDAGLAFGTGEHQTTAGCLRVLQALKERGSGVGRALDMGCGSAILAIAIAHLWPSAAVLAVDNDPDAIRTARDNVADNGCAGAVRVAVGDGYRADKVVDGAPFDLIVANILAGPLIAMAPAAAAHLAPGGRLVLSGLLSDQADAVIAAHADVGLLLVERTDIENWSTLILASGG